MSLIVLSALSCFARPHGLTLIESRSMTLNETLKQLNALGNAKVRAQNGKSGAGDNQFGVSLGDIRGKRAIAIGEKLGIYRDYPVSKGCTSPFAPIWINAIVSRQG
jgi:hypothetical protein